MPNAGYQVKEVTKHAINALNSSNITDAEVAALPSAAALVALFTNRASAPWNQRQDMEFHEESVRQATSTVASGVLAIFNDTNVPAAATLNDLRDILIGVNSELNRAFQSGNRAWQ